jgi:hypothetical protein
MSAKAVMAVGPSRGSSFCSERFSAVWHRRKTPVIFFLDDLQWADPASLEVLESLVTDTMSHHVMIICAYREGEMPAAIIAAVPSCSINNRR